MPLTSQPEGKANAVCYDDLLCLEWHAYPYSFPYKPGYTNMNGDTNYFGTDPKGKRIIQVNANYQGKTYVKILEDGGTRTVFAGQVRSIQELKLINDLVL